ncbi:MAG: efflux RND transporter periplasmic adaptor subunit [Gemmatimonadota bacterium]
MPTMPRLATTILATLLLAACGREVAPAPAGQAPVRGTPVAVLDTMITDAYVANGSAEPLRQATLSTRLMGTVNSVSAEEGDRVVAGQLLVRLDARDLEARRVQVDAGTVAADAGQREASVHASRIRALYADSAATRSQLDQAEAALSRANAAVASANGMASELAATTSYAAVRAPFTGVVTHRFVDPGAFASPGAPLITMEDATTLRVVVQVAADAIRGLRRGAAVMVTIGDTATTATVEGVVPSGPNLYTVNALTRNPAGRFLSGSAATIALPQGRRRALLIPDAAVVRQGDLVGVHTASGGLRWVTLGGSIGRFVEVLSGLAAGDSVRVLDGGR